MEPIVVEEMERLRTKKQLTLVCRPIEDIPKPKLRIMFQNVRSLRAHFEDVRMCYYFVRHGYQNLIIILIFISLTTLHLKK